MLQRFRKAISCHYAASECVIINTEGSNQDMVAQDIESTASKQGISIDFAVSGLLNRMLC